MDFGKTWQQKVIAPIGLYDLFFLDEKTWYLCGGNNSIYKTSNAGLTWNLLANVATSGQIIISVCFLDENNGFISGNGGSLMKTTNGGQSWNSAFTDNTSSHLTSIRFVNPLQGIVIGGNVQQNTSTVITTNDGGLTWAYDTSISTQRLYGFAECADKTITVVGIGGVIFNGVPGSFTDTLVAGIVENNPYDQNQQLIIYPNPANSNIITFHSSAPIGNINYLIHDSAGRLLKNEYSNNNQLDITSLPSGNYFITIPQKDKQLRTTLSIVK